MDKWLEDSADAIHSHVQNTKVISLSVFNVKLQTSCELVLPPKPDIPPCPIELECL